MTNHLVRVITISLALLPLLLSAQSFDDLNSQAYTERDNKNYRKAIDLCNEALSKKINTRSYIIRGNCRYYLGEYEGAIDDYTSALSYYSDYYSDDKEKGGIYFLRGLCRKQLERYGDAINDFGSALSYSYSEPGYVYWNRGNCNYDLGKYKESDDDYTKAIEKITSNKELSTLYKGRGSSQGELGNYETAYTYLSKAIDLDPSNYTAYWYRGYLKNAQWKTKESLVDYLKAIDILLASDLSTKNDDLVILYRNQALGYKTLLQLDSALIAINQSLKLNPNNTRAYRTRADINKDLKNYSKARADYENAISLETDKKIKAAIYLDRSMLEMNKLLNYTNTLSDLDKAIELHPQSGMNHWHKSLTYSYKKDYLNAIKECNKALDLYKSDSSSTASLIMLRAGYKEHSGDYTGAVEDYRTFLKYYPDSYNGYYELGRLFKRKMKNNDLADANLSKAAELALKESDTSKYCYISVIKGDKEEAIRKMQEQTEVTKDNKYLFKWDLHNMACIYALSGNTVKALEYVDKSLAAGYDDYNHLLNDRDLETIMKLPQWKPMLAKYKVPQPR
jgi:tetratricopeptide (TPR) repeat protein